MKNPEIMRKLLNDYSKYVSQVLEPTRLEVKELFNNWKEPSYWGKYPKQTGMPDPSPIQRVHTRTKRPESVVDKILRKPESYPSGLTAESFYKMHDAVGVRIIAYFLSSLPLIDKELRDNENIEISQDNSPVAYLTEDITKTYGLSHIKRKEKDSGYASVHYTIRLRNSSVPLENRPWFELQLRTIVEDIWGEIEHILGYKPDKRTNFAVRKHFQLLSKGLVVIDEQFNFLLEELSRYQEEIIYEDDDLLNAENLPAVLTEVGLSCAQREIDGLLKILVSHSIITIKDLTILATSKRQEVIRNTYRSEMGRSPNNFEAIANLANLIGCDEELEMTERIKTQITFLQVWEDLKKR
jgi:putative GTP pyrophosphokinase